MRRIDRTGQFKRDYKREAKGQHRATLDADLMAVLTALGLYAVLCGTPLPHFADAGLKG
jgi:mRNA-degrading endonuclease YafQ of YafQ-DinJ toxin-antitoxin module